MKLKNGNYSLKGRQLIELGEKMANQDADEGACVYCWGNKCDCNTKGFLKDDLFLNMTELHEALV